MIENGLNRAQAEELFAKNCLFLSEADAVPEHRIAELFGEGMMRDISKWSSLVGGRDYNALGSCEPGDPLRYFYYLRGFLKIVSVHNRRVQVKEHASSEGGRIVDKIDKERSDMLDALDAEEERKREERRAKRRAAMAAKKEAQQHDEH